MKTEVIRRPTDERLAWPGARTQNFVEEGAESAPLLEVLWRRRAIVVYTVVACVAVAVAYLTIATRVYRSTALVSIDQNETAVFSERQMPVQRSDEFLNTQAAIFQSTDVLSRALDAVNYKQLRTFADTGDTVNWLRHGSALIVEPVRKSDMVSVSMDSPYAQEAADFTNAVVQSYIAKQSIQKHAVGTSMIGMLEAQRAQVAKQLDADRAAMVALKQKSGVLSFYDDKGNTVMDRTALLSSSLATFQLTVVDLQTELDSAKSVLAHPEEIHAFVVGQRLKGQTLGGKQYDDAQSQLTQLILMVAELTQSLGPNNPRVLGYQAEVDSLRKQIAQQEQDAVTALTIDLPVELAAAQDKERQLRAAVAAQQEQSVDIDAKTAEYARLDADRERLQKQSDMIDSRIIELGANSADAGPLTIQLVESARPSERPVKPMKSLVLAIALIAGCLCGVSLAMLREWNDAKLRAPQEIAELAGVRVLGCVPGTPGELAWADASSAPYRQAMAELTDAFRDIGAAIRSGAARNAKTILVASPSRSEGRSTVSANLAIALAQAGHRTVLVDCDFRHPTQHRVFNVDGRLGLSNALAGQQALPGLIRATHVDDLYVLPAGPTVRDGRRVTMNGTFQHTVAALGDLFDRIVIDSPAMESGSESIRLAASADATLLVFRMNASSQYRAAAAVSTLSRAGANVIGAIANEVAPGTGGSLDAIGGAQRAPGDRAKSGQVDSDAGRELDRIASGIAAARPSPQKV